MLTQSDVCPLGKLWYPFGMIEIRKWTSALSGSPFFIVARLHSLLHECRERSSTVPQYTPRRLPYSGEMVHTHIHIVGTPLPGCPECRERPMCRSPFSARAGWERHAGRSLRSVNKKKPHTFVCGQKKKDIHSDVLVLALPIFTARHQATIVGVSELNFCVRDGNRWTLTTINTNSHRNGFNHSSI